MNTPAKKAKKAELKKAKLAYTEAEGNIFTGGYPEIWDEDLSPGKWMQSYVQTYLQITSQSAA